MLASERQAIRFNMVFAPSTLANEDKVNLKNGAFVVIML